MPKAKIQNEAFLLLKIYVEINLFYIMNDDIIY